MDIAAVYIFIFIFILFIELNATGHMATNMLKNIRSMKKTLREMQTLCPTADPLPGGAGEPKCNQLEMVATCTYRPSLMKIDARNLELSW